MAQQIVNAGDTGLVARTKWNENFTELYSNMITVVKGWGYQDFVAGTITGTNVTITANENGSDIIFDPLKVIGNTTAICLADNNLNVPYTGTTTWFSSKVSCTGNTLNEVTLSGIPNASWGNVRIFYLYNYTNKLPEGTIVAPKFLSAQILAAGDASFVTEEEYVTRIQGGSIPLSAGTHTILLTYSYSNTNYRITGDAYDGNTNDEVGYTILRSSKTTSSFDVYVNSDCVFEWSTIKL